MSRKNKIIISVTGIILVLVTLIGLTYAYYLTRINGNTNDKSVIVSLANLELTYSDGNGLIEATNIVPGEVIATKTFSVENTGDKKVINYTVYLDDVINTFTNKSDVKLTLTCTSSKGNKCTGTEITYPSTDTLLSINDIEVDEKHNYELKVEFIETNTDQSIDMNKELSGNIIIRDLKGTGSEITNTKGTNSVSVDNAKLLSNYRIYGNSVQETRSGKNLIPYPYASQTTTTNGVTFTVNDDGTIKVNGTATAVTYFTLKNKIKLDKKIYMLSGGVSDTALLDMSVRDSSNRQVADFMASNQEIKCDLTNVNYDYVNLLLVIRKDATLNNVVFKPQLEEGSTRTDYEAYGATPSPEIPSEIKSVGDLVTDTNDTNYGKYKIEINTLSIPKEYQEVEYIESTGTQYIDTEYVLKSSSVVEIEVSLKQSIPKADGALFGSRASDYGNQNVLWFNNIMDVNTATFQASIGSDTYTNNTLNFNRFYRVKFGFKELYLDDNKINTFKNNFYENDVSLILFGIKTGETVDSRRFYGKVKSFKITTDGDVVRNFIPCYRKSDNVIGFYDVIGNKFYTNKGTSNFLKGENIGHNTYNIYLDEPLRKIGNYSDYIDFKSGKVVRNIAQKIFTKDNNWIIQSTNNFYVSDPIEDAKKELVLCNYQKSTAVSLSNENAYISGTKKLNFQTYKINHTVDDLKNWLSDKELIINYILENKKEESISLPNIDLSKTKYINILSDTNPSSIELDYVK